MSRLPFRSLVTRGGGDRVSTLPFSWTSEDASLDALSGQVGTFLRSTGTLPVIDVHGTSLDAPVGLARWRRVTSGDGIQRLGLALDPGHTNLLLRSEDFATTWVPAGTPTLTAGAVVLGDLSLSRIEDNNGAAVEGYTQTVVGLSGAAAKVVALHCQAPTATAVFAVRDDTAGADRLYVSFANSGGIPVATVSTGILIGSRLLGNGVYEFLFQTTSVTPANAHTCHVYGAGSGTSIPGTSGATQGSWVVGGIGIYNQLGAVDYVRSVSAAGAVSVEKLTWPIEFIRRRSWLYVALTEQGGRFKGDGSAGWAGVGDVTDCGMGVAFSGGGTQYVGFHYANGSGDGSAIALAPTPHAFGTFLELLVSMGATGIPSIEVAFNQVSQGVAAGSVAPANMTENWTNAIMRLGAYGSLDGFVQGGSLYHALKYGEGASPTIAKARGYR